MNDTLRKDQAKWPGMQNTRPSGNVNWPEMRNTRPSDKINWLGMRSTGLSRRAKRSSILNTLPNDKAT